MPGKTYTSTNARPCPDCGQRRCPPRCGSLGLLTSVLPADAIMSGEIVRQMAPPIVLGQYTDDVTIPVVDVKADPRDYVTMTGVLEAFENQPQSHAEGSGRSGRMPVWPIACVFVGLVLAAFGLVFNDETTRFVWSLITGEPM